ncbi:hypothetical protein [Enterobacter phage 04_vB_Eclo_IJM]|nr:hypothetical protein [Enterobacter phage 04_vB_Eclo_IJM]
MDNSRIVCIWTPRPQWYIQPNTYNRTPSLHWWHRAAYGGSAPPKGNYFMDDQGAYVCLGLLDGQSLVNIR